MVWSAAPSAPLRYACDGARQPDRDRPTAPVRAYQRGPVVVTTEDPLVQGRSESPPASARAAAWWWLVAISVIALVAVGATLAIWWAASRETRTTSYRVLG